MSTRDVTASLSLAYTKPTLTLSSVRLHGLCFQGPQSYVEIYNAVRAGQDAARMQLLRSSRAQESRTTFGTESETLTFTLTGLSALKDPSNRVVVFDDAQRFTLHTTPLAWLS
jgi:hypothetical protein